MRIQSLLSNATYAGKAEGDRHTYHVFATANAYLLLAPNNTGGYTLNPVPADAPDVIGKRFRGRRITAGQVREFSRRFAGFAALNALYVMVALGRAQRLAKREGRAFIFKIKD